MAKKFIAVFVTLSLIACSTISIYAAEEENITESTNNTNVTIEQNIDAEEAESKISEGEKSQEEVKKKEDQKNAENEKKQEEKLKNGLAAYIRKINPTVSESKSKNMAEQFMIKGDKYNLDPKVLMAIAQGESTFYTNAKSPYGYKGLMQTSDALARKYGYKPSSLYKASVSIEVGARYLSQMKKMFKTYTKAISAYAYGDGAVKSGNYSTAHAKKVLDRRDAITRYLRKNNYIS